MRKPLLRKSIPITRELVSNERRNSVLFSLFSRYINLELLVQGFLLALAEDYEPCELQLFLLSNGSCYAAPKGDQYFALVEKHNRREIFSSDGIGIVASLKSLSYLSFSVSLPLSQISDSAYSRILEALVDHPERSSILETTR
jgi:hypothetical protein